MSASRTAKASAQGLEKVKAASAQKGWHKTSPALLDAACVSAATLKRFWRGIPIGEDSFQAICAAVNLDCDEVLEEVARFELAFDPTSAQQIAQPIAKRPSFEFTSSTSGDICFGRVPLIQKLYAQLTDTTRALSITGLTGIGKTALARQLASLLSDQGYSCIYISCDQQKLPTLASIAHSLSQQDTGKATQLGLSLPSLVAHLQKHKYLFMIDALEGLLTHNLETGWSEFQNGIWPQFFEAILRAEKFSSRFILTAQDIPNELDSLGELWPDRWCAHALGGLTHDEQISLFQAFGLSPAPQSRAYEQLSSLGQLYAGHPLSLGAIAQDIATAFNGNIAAYWREHQQIETHRNLHSHSRHLRKQVQPRLAHMLNRLKAQQPYAYQLLCAAATADSRPRLSHSWLQIARKLHTETSQPRRLIDVLCDRAFLTPIVINNRLHFDLHPLFQSFLLAPRENTPLPPSFTPPLHFL
jgi:hypothetical protein